MIGFRTGFRTGFTNALTSFACCRRGRRTKKAGENDKKLLHLIVGRAILKVRWTKQ